MKCGRQLPGGKSSKEIFISFHISFHIAVIFLPQLIHQMKKKVVGFVS